MPRKRRHPKKRPPLPTGLDGISRCERSLWSKSGPLLEAAVDAATLSQVTDFYAVWPNWETWGAFYGSVRAELFAARPWRAESSIAEHCWAALQAGADPEAVRCALLEARQADDPRRRR